MQLPYKNDFLDYKRNYWLVEARHDAKSDAVTDPVGRFQDSGVVSESPLKADRETERLASFEFVSDRFDLPDYVAR